MSSAADDKLSLAEFRRVCEAAGVESDDPGEMEYDYAMGQAIGEVIDRMCVLAEERPDQPLDHARHALELFLAEPSVTGALESAARLVRWAGEQAGKDGVDEN